MEKGKIIYLNGVTSTGKTSIVRALQEDENIFFYGMSNDLFAEMVGERYYREDFWKNLSDVIFLMYHTAKLFSDRGKNVIIDGMIVEREEFRPHYQQILEIFKDNPLCLVEVYCPLEICRQRNIARGDRGEWQSHDQDRYMARDVCHHVRVDTSQNSPKECANQIICRLFAKTVSEMQ